MPVITYLLSRCCVCLYFAPRHR